MNTKYFEHNNKSSVNLLLCDKNFFSRNFTEINNRKLMTKELSSIYNSQNKNLKLIEIITLASKLGYIDIVKQYIDSIYHSFETINIFINEALTTS